MQTRTLSIYSKAIDVIKSCKTVKHIDSANRYVDLAIKQIGLDTDKPKSIQLMVSNLQYYLRMKKKAVEL